MIRGRGWTGFYAAALQEAMRKSNREFAALLGVETTTINNWRSGLSTVKPRPLTQKILDTVYRQHTTSEDRTRFEQIVAEGESVWRSRHPATPRQTRLPTLAGSTDHADSPRQPAGGAADPTTRPQEMSECRAKIEGEDEVNRRQFGVSALSAIALTGTTAQLPQQPLASAKRLHQQPLASGKRLGLAEVRGWLTFAEEIDQRDQREGGAGLVREAHTTLLQARGQLDSAHCDPATATAAASAVGNVAVIAGWVAYDSEHHDLARACYREGLELSARSGDNDLAVHSLLNAAALEISLSRQGSGNPYLALQNINRAAQIAQHWKPGRIHALIAVRQAQAWARIGSHDDFRTAMNHAHAAMDTALNSELLTHCPRWLRFVDPIELAGHEARAYGDLGDHRAALDLYERALEGQSIRNEANTRAWYAATRAAVGDLRGALAEAEPVLATLEDVGSTRTLRVLAPLRSHGSKAEEFTHRYDKIAQKTLTT